VLFAKYRATLGYTGEGEGKPDFDYPEKGPGRGGWPIGQGGVTVKWWD